MKDYFGNDPGILRSKRLFLFDMDGTIYNDGVLFDGTLELLEEIRAKGGTYVFITNNSSRSVLDYIALVNGIGIEADRDNFFTSTQAAALLLKERHSGAKVFCMGTRSLVKELREEDICVTEKVEDDIDVILVGFDTEITGEKLKNTCFLLGRELPFYATNCDLRCPVSFGYIPDCGSICKMLEVCTGKKPVYIGKPEPTMIEMAMKKYGAGREETVVIGDRVYTDIAAGVNAGVTSVCVLSGEATVQDVISGAVKPTLTLGGVKEILEILRS